jgi:hypothetical protein
VHLKNIDQQIGSNVLRPRVKNVDFKSVFGPSDDEIFKNAEKYTSNLKKINNEKKLSSYNLCERFKSNIQKAYTIAGGVPSYVFRNSLSNKNTHDSFNTVQSDINQKNADCIFAEEDNIEENPKSLINTMVCDNLFIVAEDVLLFMFMILIFACDLVNLINDSGILQVEKNTNYEWFVTILELYNQILFFIIFTTVLSVHLAYKRPKLSRFLMCLGFILNLFVHVQLFDFKNEEQFILEVFVSFFLAIYLVMARIYNVFQLFRYM